MKKLKLFSLLMLLFVGVTQMWGADPTLVITRSCFPSGALAYNVTDDWTATTSTSVSISGKGDIYSTASQTTLQTKASGVSTHYYNTTAMPSAIKQISVSVASGTDRTYTVYASASAAISSTSTLTSIGSVSGASALDIDVTKGYKYFAMVCTGGASFLNNITITFASSDPTISFEQPTGGELALVDEGDNNISSGDEVAEGTAVTITATPGEGYKLPATITFYDENDDEIANPATALTFIEDESKNGGLFEMPDYNITIAASFTAKAQSVVTVSNPSHGTITVTGAADLTSVMEGTELIVEVSGSGYTFTPKAYKTGEQSTEVTIDGEGKLTMPDYAITITADEAEITNPSVSGVPTELNFAAKQNWAVTPQNFTLKGAKLTGNLTLASNNEAFVVSPTSITKAEAEDEDGVVVTISPATPTATTTPVEGTLTISGGGLDPNVTVALSMVVTPTYLVEVAVNDANYGSATLNSVASYYAVENEELALVATPKPGHEFVNWTYDDNVVELADADDATTTTTVIIGAATITANFNVIPSYTVTLMDDTEHPLTEEYGGAGVTLPSRSGCTGYTFAGWTASWVAEQSVWTTTAPTIIPAGAYAPTADVNLYPVYTKSETGEPQTDQTIYFEPFTGSAHSTGVESTNVAATTDMFTDATATVWSHYAFDAASTTSYATNLDGDEMSNGVKISRQANNTTVTMMEVTGIKITGASDMSLSLYNRRTYTSATLKVSYKIDNGSYTAVGGTIVYNSTNDKWKLCDGLTISGTGNSLSLKIELVVSGTTNRTMVLDDIKVTGTTVETIISYISVPSCSPSDIDNTVVKEKAVKKIVNGQLFIESNGHVYNAMGQLVK